MVPPTQHARPRLAPMADLDALGELADERFDRVVRLAQHVFRVPIAAVNLVDDVSMTTLASVGLPLGESPRAGRFCEVPVETGAAFVVSDATVDLRFADAPFVTGDPHLRFYAGEPLRAPSGQAVGTLCIYDDKPREISPLESRMLRDLADWVEKELAYDHDSAQAREVQRRLLPRHDLIVPGYEIAGRSVPARNVGGDYFDWQVLDGDVVQIVVADVMGKGMEAAVIAAGVRAVLRGGSRFNPLDRTIGRSAMSMEEDLSHTRTFVTMFAARLQPESGSLEYVDAGHGLAIIIQPSGEFRRLVSEDLPLGTVPNDTWHIRYDHLDPGETLLVVSDGILDFFPDPSAAVKAGVVLSLETQDAREIVKRIAAIGGGEPLDDDITAVVIRREPA